MTLLPLHQGSGRDSEAAEDLWEQEGVVAMDYKSALVVVLIAYWGFVDERLDIRTQLVLEFCTIDTNQEMDEEQDVHLGWF